MTRARRAGAVIGLAAALALSAYKMADETNPHPLAISARPVPLDPVDPAHDTVGRLRYLGGIELRSPDRRLGGLSGMRFLPDGRLLTISDEGWWIVLRLAEQDGRLIGAGGATIARMAGRDGRPLRIKAESDAEALEVEGEDRIVAFERQPRVLRYGPGGSRPVQLPFPDEQWLEKLPPNTGIEAMARIGRAWLYLAKNAGKAAWNAVLARPGALGTNYARLRYQGPEGFEPSDAAALDGSHAVVLERRDSPLIGTAAAVSIVGVDPSGTALGRPDTLAILATPLTVDAMEAIAVRSEGGRTVLYLASDDAYSPLQRTLILKFELLPR